MMPQCFLSSFKVFEFKGFNANEHDLLFGKVHVGKCSNLGEDHDISGFLATIFGY
jgi:hypothetical protein